MNDWFVSWLKLATAGLLACAAWGPATAADFTLRLNHTLPAVSIRQTHAELFRDAVAKASAGRVEVQIFPAGQLYRNDQDAIKALRSGSVEGAMVTTGDLSLFEPSFNLYEAPFLYRDYAHLDAVIDSPVGKAVFDRLERLGLKALAHTNAGSAALLTRPRPVRSVDDLKGMRLRASAGQIQIKAFDLMGVSSIQLPFPDVPPSLERGVIDGMVSTPAAAASAKLGEITKYVTWTRHQLFPPVVAVNLAWWNRLPQDVRDGILKAMPEFTREARRINIEAEKQAMDALRKQGATVIELSPAGQQGFRARLEPIYAEVRQRVGPELYDQALKVLDSVK
ncbi:MAG: TRAP transporter substrate-binding protein [Betaproteobacteria bacterium]|nr:TRAP transporter substrate-binding protein [Betaproteobacteria bacterium]